MKTQGVFCKHDEIASPDEFTSPYFMTDSLQNITIIVRRTQHELSVRFTFCSVLLWLCTHLFHPFPPWLLHKWSDPEGYGSVNKNYSTRVLRWLLQSLNLITAPAWWRHQMETFSALLAICAGNSPVPGDSSMSKSNANDMIKLGRRCTCKIQNDGHL